MTKTTNTPQTHPPATSLSPVARFNPLLITFLMKRSGSEIQVRCRGCREIVPLDNSMPNPLKGLIELDGQPVPVIDANARFGAEGTKLGCCSCIVVVEHECESQHLRTGVIVGDIEDVMQLAAGCCTAMVAADISANRRLVAEMLDTTTPRQLFAETGRELRSSSGKPNPTLALPVADTARA